MENLQNLKTLEQCLAQNKVPEKDVTFVTSLIEKAHKGYLRPNGWGWVRRMAHRLSSDKPTTVTTDFSGVYNLLLAARQRMKYPKIRLRTKNGLDIVLYVSGPKSRLPDMVNITDGGASWERAWFGRINREGVWSHSEDVKPNQVSDIQALLTKLAKDPAKVASDYGRLTGNCCFCYRPLKDERSTQVGYGPVCASNFQLPWG